VQNEANDFAEAQERDLGQYRDIRCAMGDCVNRICQPMADWMLPITIAIPIIMGVLGYFFIECDCEIGICSIPFCIWLVWLPMAAFHVKLEWQFLSFSTIPYIQRVEYWKICGFRVGFRLWTLFGLAQSLALLVSLASNSLFAIQTLLYQRQCNPKMEIEIWQETLAQSMVSMLSHVSFGHLAVASWLTLLIHPLFVLISTYIPKFLAWSGCTRENLHASGKRLSDTVQVVSAMDAVNKFQEHNLYFSKVDSSSFYMAIATASGMSTIMNQSPSLEITAGRQILVQLNMMMLRGVRAYWCSRVAAECLMPVKPLLISGAGRLFFLGFLRNGAMLNLRISHMAIRHAVFPDTLTDWHEIGALIVSIAAQLPTFKYMYDLQKFTKDAMASLFKVTEQFKSEEAPEDNNVSKLTEEERDAWREMADQVVAALPSTRRILCVTYAAAWFLLALLMYSVVKLAMIFHCPYALWNLNGCADLSHYLHV